MKKKKSFAVKPAVRRAHFEMEKDPHHALALVDEVLADDPDDPQAHSIRGRILAFHLDRPAQARASLEVAYTTVVNEGFFDPSVHLSFEKCLVMLGERKQARLVLDRCLSVYPDELDAWLDRANLSFSEGALTAALADLDEVLGRDPRHPIGLYNRACYLAVEGSSDAALDALEAAIAVNPDDRDAARDDDDFASLRKQPRFKKLVAPPKSRR
ncbi:MAG: tetratricopeptide repeat protein [Archangium sp.]|nr:tetratricopeptide repeat protein [Archangium sp.]MDP3573757.1 tetratricopeptide repeat protein [Archangium sp.]